MLELILIALVACLSGFVYLFYKEFKKNQEVVKEGLSLFEEWVVLSDEEKEKNRRSINEAAVPAGSLRTLSNNPLSGFARRFRKWAEKFKKVF